MFVVLLRPNPDNIKPYTAAMDRLSSAAEALRRTDPIAEAGTISQMVSSDYHSTRKILLILIKRCFFQI